MSTPIDLVRLSIVRDATGISINHLRTLISFDVLPGVQRRNSHYFRRDQVPTRDEIITAVRQALAEQLTLAAKAANRIRNEYEATANDAHDAIDQLKQGLTPARLGPDLSIDGTDRTAFTAAQHALHQARLFASMFHRILVEETGHSELAWAN